MSKDKSTPKISDIFSAKNIDTPNSNKRTCSTLSPAECESTAKKQPLSTSDETHIERSTDLQLILHEFKSLKETVDNRVSRIESAIIKQEDKVTEELQKIENAVAKTTKEITSEIKTTVTKNSLDIVKILHENKLLHKENNELKDRISKIETLQLCNNVIITGVPEQQWEPSKQQIRE